MTGAGGYLVPALVDLMQGDIGGRASFPTLERSRYDYIHGAIDIDEYERQVEASLRRSDDAAPR